MALCITSFLLALATSIVLAEPAPLQLDILSGSASIAQLSRRDTNGTVLAPLLEQTPLEHLYYFKLSIGTPPQLDTGSSDLWVPSVNSQTCQKSGHLCASTGSYDSNKSSTYELLDAGKFFESYVTPSTDKGVFASDVVQFGDVSLPNTTFGIAINETGVASASSMGILGMSYTALQYSDRRNFTYPTVLDMLYTTGKINRHAFSLYLNDRNNGKGSILFGGVDSAKYTGELIALPMIMDDYYGNKTVVEYRVALTSIGLSTSSGSTEITITSSNFTGNAVLDSGTTIMYIPEEAANALFASMGAVELEVEGTVINVTECSYGTSGASLDLQFGGPTGPFVNVSYSALLQDIGIKFGNGEPACYIQVAANPPEQGYGYVLGDAFLRSAYVVYDQENNQVAIAQAKLNATDSNIQVIPAGSGLPGVSHTATATAPEITRALPKSTGAANATTASTTSAASSSTVSSYPTTLPQSPSATVFPTQAAASAAANQGAFTRANGGSVVLGLLLCTVCSIFGGILLF